MLSKTYETVRTPPVIGRVEQAFSRNCPPGRGTPGGSQPVPGNRCTVVYFYGPYIDPQTGDRQLLGYKTVCV